MTDEPVQIHDMQTGTLTDAPEKPLASLVEAEKKIDPPTAPAPEPKSEPEPDDPGAIARLRAFEDKMFGPNAVRIDGRIERGIGSAYQNMTDRDKDQHAALERLVEAEKHLMDAHQALMQADDAHQAALAAVDAAAKEPDHADAGK